MKALGIMAGPRKGQVTEHLLDEALRGLRDKGNEIKKVNLYDLEIKPCLACYKCRESGACVINDGFKAVAEDLLGSDTVVFASPVYVGNVTSVAKAFFDRGLSLFKMTSFGPKWLHDKPKKIILITSCYTPFPFSHLCGVIPGCLNAMKMFFGLMGARIKSIAATGRMRDFDPKRCRGILNRAYRLGLNS